MKHYEFRIHVNHRDVEDVFLFPFKVLFQLYVDRTEIERNLISKSQLSKPGGRDPMQCRAYLIP